MASSQGATSGGERFADWRSIDDYPSANSHGHAFAWEFLRRSSEYRRDWSKYLSWMREKAADDKLLLAAIETIEWPNRTVEIAAENNFSVLQLEEGVKTLASYSFQGVRVPDRGVHALVPQTMLMGRRWGIKRMRSPWLSSTQGSLVGFFSVDAPLLVIPSAHAAVEHIEQQIIDGGTKVVISIDLSFPAAAIHRKFKTLVRQLKAFGESTGALQETKPRAVNGELLVQYLRQLDAEADGTHGVRDVARAVLPEWAHGEPSNAVELDDQVRKALQAAKLLRDGGYRVLVKRDA